MLPGRSPRHPLPPPPALFWTRRSVAAGTGRALASSRFPQGGSTSPFDFALYRGCPASSRRPCVPHPPSGSSRRAGRPLRRRRGAGPAALPARLENKSRASRVHFRRFPSSHRPAPPCGAQSIAARRPGRPGWARPVLSGAALAGRSRAGTARGRRSCGAAAGTVPVRQPASRTYTAAARAANKAAGSLRTAALHGSCHRSTGSGCGENNRTATAATKRRATAAIRDNRVAHSGGCACGGRAGRAAAAPQRSSSLRHLLTSYRQEKLECAAGPPPPPRTLPLRAPSTALQPEAASAPAAAGEAAGSLPAAVYK